MTPQSIMAQDAYLEYLRRLDARKLLDYYGAQNCREQLNKDGTTEIIHSCLLDRVEPHHNNADANPSAAFNIDKKKYCCYAGGWSGDAFHLIMKMEGKEAFAEVLPTVGDLLSGATVEGATLRTELDTIFSAPAAYSINPSTYDESILSAWARPHPYWSDRGITQQAINILKLGYDEKTQRIVFPHFMNGALVGWQKRVIPGLTAPDFPKYKSSPGFPKAESLYAYDLLTEGPGTPILVVESPMSVAKAYSMGLMNVVATFGAKVSEHQIKLLKAAEKVIVWFDADPAGQTGEHRLLEALHHQTTTFRVRPAEGKDLGDIEDLDEFCLYTALHTMPGALRLAEIDHARRFRR